MERNCRLCDKHMFIVLSWRVKSDATEQHHWYHVFALSVSLFGQDLNCLLIVVESSSPSVHRSTPCLMSVGEIVLVLMAGERGTEIRDDLPQNALSTSSASEHHRSVTLYEHTIYLLRIQLDCSGQMSTGLSARGCNLAQHVNAWIDLNNDGHFSQSESAAHHRWPVGSYLPEGIYDLQVYVPRIDGTHLAKGPHTMRLIVSPTQSYTSYCHRTDYNQTRDYTVNILPRIYSPGNCSLTLDGRHLCLFSSKSLFSTTQPWEEFIDVYQIVQSVK